MQTCLFVCEWLVAGWGEPVGCHHHRVRSRGGEDGRCRVDRSVSQDDILLQEITVKVRKHTVNGEKNEPLLDEE